MRNEYDYEQAVRNDIEDWLEDNEKAIIEDWRGEGTLSDWLADHDDWHANISGNLDGSYWFNTWEAERALCGNEDILQEALGFFGIEDPKLDDPEWCDVVIREYLVGNLLYEIAQEWEEEISDCSDWDEWAQIDEHLIIANGDEAAELIPAAHIRGAVSWNGELWEVVSRRKIECHEEEERMRIKGA